MKTRGFRFALVAMVAIAAALVLTGVWAANAVACTGIHLTAGDGSIIYARTLEFGGNLQSNMLVIPRGQEYVGETPDHADGFHWTTKYGFVGPNVYGTPYVCDGMNEKGLAVGIFMFPDTAGYQKIGHADIGRAIGSYQVAVYLLGTCTTVNEAVAALEGVRVGLVDKAPYQGLLQLHYAVSDAEGHCAVIEYIDGQMHVYDNPLGVITNSPGFDWHQTNLRNYIHLSPYNAAPVEMSGEKLIGFGQGTGLWGLPGDFTPPSRFVRAVAFTQARLPAATGEQCMWQAFHFLNQFDLPVGAIRADNHGKTAVEFTNWTTAADLKHLRYYFHTFLNRQVKMLDLNKIDWNAKTIKVVSMQEPDAAQDVSSTATEWNGQE